MQHGLTWSWAEPVKPGSKVAPHDLAARPRRKCWWYLLLFALVCAAVAGGYFGRPVFVNYIWGDDDDDSDFAPTAAPAAARRRLVHDNGVLLVDDFGYVVDHRWE